MNCCASNFLSTPSATAVGCFVGAFLAPHGQSVFVSAVFVIFALRLPFFASSAFLLLYTFVNTMEVLVIIIFLDSPSFFLVTLPGIFGLTLPAPDPEAVRSCTILAELTLVFSFFTFAALLHFLHP
jgi:hypothetical protein